MKHRRPNNNNNNNNNKDKELAMVFGYIKISSVILNLF